MILCKILCAIVLCFRSYIMIYRIHLLAVMIVVERNKTLEGLHTIRQEKILKTEH